MQIAKFFVKSLIPQKYLKINSLNYCYGVLSNNNPSLWSNEDKRQNVEDISIITCKESEDEIINCALHTVNTDLSVVTPYYPKSFNLAAYVNTSETLQNLVHLNVNLSKIEKKPYIAEKLLKLDFEQNIKKHLFFLKDFIDENEIGDFLTKNPMILCEDLEDLEVRINYLESRKFLTDQIKRIVLKNPFWLMYNTQRIDKRLGYFQGKFGLSGSETRYLSTKQPRIITYNLHHVNTNTFVIREEMGFKDNEVKALLLSKPRLLMINQRSLLERFNYIHNVMKIPHATILKHPEVLQFRNFKIKQRHLFLDKLGRAQFNPNKENYVPITGLIEGTDAEFCKKYAKCNVDDFNIFLKTL